MVFMEVEIPLELPSLANASWHWSKKHKVRKLQKWMVKTFVTQKRREIPESGPWQVILTRMAPRLLDEDNLVSAFKNITDAIAEIIHPGLAPGRADGLGDVKFEYRQEKAKIPTLRVQID